MSPESRRAPSESRRVKELESEVEDLMEEVERYRSAAEDALQQLDWCIGYLAGSQKGRVAKVLSANRAHIRRQYLRRGTQATPAVAGAKDSS